MGIYEIMILAACAFAGLRIARAVFGISIF